MSTQNDEGTGEFGPRGQHPWAKRPDWEKYLADAITRWEAKGNKIKVHKPTEMTSVDKQGNLLQPKRKGRQRVLPPMQPYQKQVYYRLKKEGYTQEEAIRIAQTKGRKHKESL